MIVAKGATNVSVYYYIRQDASATSPGEPVTGLLFSDIETGGSASYVRQGAARVDLTLITLASASATHADGGFILVDDTNMPGLYRCDYPDATFVTGADVVTLQIVVASANNAVADPIFVQLTGVDLQDVVRGGMTAIPNAAADAAGGLPISDAGGLALDTQLAATNEITAARMGALTDWINGGRLDLLLDAIPTTAMRGTDSALLAASINLTAGAVDNVTLVATTTMNTDMRGTDSAATATALATVDSNVDSILVDTAEIGAAGAGLTAIMTTQMTQSYAVDGVAPTPAEALFMLQQLLGDFSIAGTTLTVREIDGVTTAATYTLNDATTPTALTRTT